MTSRNQAALEADRTDGAPPASAQEDGTARRWWMVGAPLGELPPFPEGWYFVATRETLARKKGLIERTWMGEEIVAWVDGDGRVCVADAFCPHLGSHMGPAVGGIVRDGCLVCPFHGFQFDTSGRCVATPNAPPPKAARLKVYETREILGMIFAWYGMEGRPPEWDLPDEPTAGDDWCEPISRTVRFRGHPQETTENGVDIEHLSYTHGYADVEPVSSVSIDGAYMKSCFDFKTVVSLAGFKIVSDIAAVTHVHGLGYSLVEFSDPSMGMETRLWVLTTPVDGVFVETMLVTQSRKSRRPPRFFAGVGFLPARLRQWTINRLALAEAVRFLMEDVVIWERKRYRAPPRLSQADGPIGKFRLYCRQFYPAPQADGNSGSRTAAGSAAPRGNDRK